MNTLILDVETTISNKGSPFDLTNKCVMVGLKDTKYQANTYGFLENNPDFIEHIQNEINSFDLLVGFNIKFDIHWLRKIGIDISKIKVWDCQLAEFILNYQKTPYPSLDGTAEKYGLPKKLDIVRTEYWEKGVDTDKIPPNILSEYLTQDLVLTQQVYEKQVEQFKTNGLLPLFRLQCADLLVLEDMEFNGIKFNTEKAVQRAKEIDEELERIYSDIISLTDDTPINLNSNDHISCLLYGGTIGIDYKIPVGFYKTGTKIGEMRYKILTKEYVLPRRVEPIKGSETVKEGYWKVNETILRQLKLTKETKKIVDLLQRHSELEKLSGTYLKGYSNLIEKMNWPKDMLHGTLNQCVAVTGRLSSTKPNLQNADKETKKYMETRYEN